jgi:hypothetical protein
LAFFYSPYNLRIDALNTVDLSRLPVTDSTLSVPGDIFILNGGQLNLGTALTVGGTLDVKGER